MPSGNLRVSQATPNGMKGQFGEKGTGVTLLGVEALDHRVQVMLPTATPDQDAAKPLRRHWLVRTVPSAGGEEPRHPAGRARQEIDYGRRDKGYVLGAFQPATGAAFTQPVERRTTATWVAFLEQVDARIPPAIERIYAILDNLSTHRAPDVLLFVLAHPRWEFVFQPKYAAYLNLIEPWWKVLRSRSSATSQSMFAARSLA